MSEYISRKLLIMGAGGHGKVTADCAAETGLFERIAFLDDVRTGQTILGFPVIGQFEDAKHLRSEFTHAFIALGNDHLRVELIDKMIDYGYNVPAIVHPSAIVSKYARLSAGSHVVAGAVINAGADIGKGCIINTCASVDHECIIGVGVHISPGARLGGMVSVGDFTWICIGASIANNINIGSNSIVAAGATVLTDVVNNTMVAGTPAREKKTI